MNIVTYILHGQGACERRFGDTDTAWAEGSLHSGTKVRRNARIWKSHYKNINVYLSPTILLIAASTGGFIERKSAALVHTTLTLKPDGHRAIWNDELLS